VAGWLCIPKGDGRNIVSISCTIDNCERLHWQHYCWWYRRIKREVDLLGRYAVQFSKLRIIHCFLDALSCHCLSQVSESCRWYWNEEVWNTVLEVVLGEVIHCRFVEPWPNLMRWDDCTDSFAFSHNKVSVALNTILCCHLNCYRYMWLWLNLSRYLLISSTASKSVARHCRDMLWPGGKSGVCCHILFY
jgi:hypothetical protein